MRKPKIGVIGEFSPEKKTHATLNQALDLLKNDFSFDYEWIATDEIERNGEAALKGLAGIWSASGSPFKSLDGALKAIEHARRHDIPHLGTCAGFQHTMLEYARNVMGIDEAQNEEYDENASVLFISRLTCSLAGKTMSLQIKENTKAYGCYNKSVAKEDYYCNFGINPAFKGQIEKSGLVISGVDQDNEIRIVEIPENRFFMATLFVPHSNPQEGNPHPIIKAFVQASVELSAIQCLF